MYKWFHQRGASLQIARTCLCIDVAQMMETATIHQWPVIQRQRRTSAVHLAGLSVLTRKHTALGASRRQKRNSSVSMHALTTRDALRWSGLVHIAGCTTHFVNFYRTATSQRFKSSDSVILCQVRDVTKLITLRAKLSGAVYCYRSCLWRAGGVCLCVGLWVCYHDNSKLRGSIFTKLGL